MNYNEFKRLILQYLSMFRIVLGFRMRKRTASQPFGCALNPGPMGPPARLGRKHGPVNRVFEDLRGTAMQNPFAFAMKSPFLGRKSPMKNHEKPDHKSCTLDSAAF